MRLRNKKTGEIRRVMGETFGVATLAELNEEWEDYEDPEVCYFIDPAFKVGYCRRTTELCPDLVKRAKELGIGFETKEEAEKAVKKLKAWKRLREKGFEFDGWGMASSDMVVIYAKRKFDSIQGNKDLHLLFGSEE